MPRATPPVRPLTRRRPTRRPRVTTLLLPLWIAALLAPAANTAAAGVEIRGTDDTFRFRAAEASPDEVAVAYTIWQRVAGTSDPDGSTQDLVLIHGWASDRTSFRPVLDVPEAAELLTRGHRVIALDLPGHGASEPLPDLVPYSQRLFAAAVTQLLDHVGSERVVVVGHSNGTPIARLVAAKDERVVGLVAVDGQVVPVATAEMIRPMLEPLRTKPGETAEALVRGMTGSVPGALREEAVEALVEMARGVDPRAMVETLQSAVDDASWPNVPLEVPVLLVLAQQPTWDETYRERVELVAEDVTWVVWKEAIHFLQLQRPVEFAHTMADWLTQNQ